MTGYIGRVECFPLLGRAGLFGKFLITFDEYNEKVIMKRNSQRV
jgi:hypothetical protein